MNKNYANAFTIPSMGMLIDNVKVLIEQAQLDTGKSITKILGLSGINPSQYYRCLSDNRPFSEEMLRAMADSEYIKTNYAQLTGWKLIDEYGSAEVVIDSILAILTPADQRQILESLEQQERFQRLKPQIDAKIEARKAERQ